MLTTTDMTSPDLSLFEEVLVGCFADWFDDLVMAFQNWFAANTTGDLGLHVLTLDHVFTELFAD